VSRAVHEVYPKFKTLPNHDVAYSTTNDIVVSSNHHPRQELVERCSADEISITGLARVARSGYIPKVVLSALRRYDLSLRILRDDESHDSTVTAKRTRKSSFGLYIVSSPYTLHILLGPFPTFYVSHTTNPKLSPRWP
jgi:hypothetical protein